MKQGIKGLVYILFCITGISFGQNQETVTLTFSVAYKSQALPLPGTKCRLTPETEAQVDKLQFYISNIQFYSNEQPVFREIDSYHLIDISDLEGCSILLKLNPAEQYDAIGFNFGIDSITNVSGIRSGDLDPAKAMYWTWQSGYINFKLEGSFIQKNTLKDKFEYHLGGYLSPFVSTQTIKLSVEKKNAYEIKLNLQNFFNALDLSKQKRLMLPGAESVFLSKQLAKGLTIK